ncbi:hypothetical protein DFH06DRAFT_292533 [Mycena polygramma]|nr:hypothetical protein DFH06DRAFT_292533 [Mycena polygramma]
MEGVQELRACIEALSSRINLQKELLKNLERDKSLVQRQLNAALDPVARLPLEISSEIFLQTLPLSEEPNPRHAPILLLRVCSAWNTIAISTPALWVTIRAVFPCTGRSEAGLQAWFRRAGSYPLFVSLRGTFNDGDAPTFVWEYGRLLKRLEICDEQEEPEADEDHSARGEETNDLLGDWRPEQLPLLETLSIHEGKFSGQQILELLRWAPNLVACTLENLALVADYETENPVETLVLPALRQFRFRARPNGSKCILRFLTLPALQTLSLSLHDISGDLLSLLKRSSPPLKELIMTDCFWRSATLYECLHLTPSVQCFEMVRPGGQLPELYAALDKSQSILPNLHTLRIIGLYQSKRTLSDSCWETLLRVLSSRPELRTVHVELAQAIFAESRKPGADRLAEFGELAKNGMQIYIGFAGTGLNLVSV